MDTASAGACIAGPHLHPKLPSGDIAAIAGPCSRRPRPASIAPHIPHRHPEVTRRNSRPPISNSVTLTDGSNASANSQCRDQSARRYCANGHRISFIHQDVRYAAACEVDAIVFGFNPPVQLIACHPQMRTSHNCMWKRHWQSRILPSRQTSPYAN
jgi:hypothetical protein